MGGYEEVDLSVDVDLALSADVRSSSVSWLWSVLAVSAVVVIALLSTPTSRPMSAQAPKIRAAATYEPIVTAIVIQARHRTEPTKPAATAPTPTVPARRMRAVVIKPRPESGAAVQPTSADVAAATGVLAQARRESSL